MRVRYSRRALRQVSEILGIVDADAPLVASQMADRIEVLTALLARHPTMGRATDFAGVRVFSLRPYPYLVFYRVEEGGSGVTILRVRHMSRDEDWRTGM
jgi:plasmid stabilization system protein ParE